MDLNSVGKSSLVQQFTWRGVYAVYTGLATAKGEAYPQ